MVALYCEMPPHSTTRPFKLSLRGGTDTPTAHAGSISLKTLTGRWGGCAAPSVLRQGHVEDVATDVVKVDVDARGRRLQNKTFLRQCMRLKA